MSIKIQTGGKLLFFFLGAVLVFNLSRNLLRLWRAGDRLRQAKEKLAAVKTENLKLKEEQRFLESDFFIEEQIRDKLNLVKLGEAVVILPPTLSDKQAESLKSNDEEVSLPVWRQWLALFW